MAAIAKWCVFGFLVLTSLTEAQVTTKAPEEIKCVLVTLKSTAESSDTQEIYDESGRRIEITSLTVIKSYSPVKCELNDTIIFSDPFIMARGGCNAQIRVCYKLVFLLTPTAAAGCISVRLLSRLNREVQDEVYAPIVSMKVILQFPDGVACEEGKNYGYREQVVYANSGCRADFEVCLSENPPRDDQICEEIILNSTKTTPDERKIVDKDGNPVTILTMKPMRSFLAPNRCELWRDYFFNDTFLIARGGCIAKFSYCYVRNKTIQTTIPPQANTTCVDVVLASWRPQQHDMKKITAPDGSSVVINSFKLIKQDSNNTCIETKTFFIGGPDEVHVTDECRGTFRVCYV